MKNEFIYFLRSNSETLARSVLRVCYSRPISMNKNIEERMNIGRLFQASIMLSFPANEINNIINESFDLIYNDDVFISLKTQSKIFKTFKKNGIETKATPVILVNKKGDKTENILDEIKCRNKNYAERAKKYYILLIDFKFADGKTKINIGCIDKENKYFKEYIYSDTSDQIKIKIEDVTKLDFFESFTFNGEPPHLNGELDNLYLKSKSKLFNDLLKYGEEKCKNSKILV